LALGQLSLDVPEDAACILDGVNWGLFAGQVGRRLGWMPEQVASRSLDA
jgi:hypothetical protein